MGKPVAVKVFFSRVALEGIGNLTPLTYYELLSKFQKLHGKTGWKGVDLFWRERRHSFVTTLLVG